MKGRQLAMDSVLAEIDFDEQERKKHEWARERERTDAFIRILDEKYGRMDTRHVWEKYPEGSVVIVGQNLYRDDHYTMHFYRTVLGYHPAFGDPHMPHLVEAQSEEWPDIPPWADTIGHEGEARDIHINGNLMYWATGEVTEPIITWWQKAWGEKA